MRFEFEDQVAVVVGAASGIGMSTAIEFRLAGATVGWLDRSPRVTAIANQHETSRGVKGCSSGLVVDATDDMQLAQAAETLMTTSGRIDHVVVSIGMGSGTFGFPFWNLEPDVWREVLDVNLIAAVRVAHAFVPHMLSNGKGTICFVASVAGQTGSQTDPPYSAAKAGLINFAQCAAKDLAPYNIRVNAVSPGMVKTPLNQQVWRAWRERSPEHTLTYDEWAEAKIKQVSPLGRWQAVEEVAAAILFLASDRAISITGQTINVDGGQVMHA